MEENGGRSAAVVSKGLFVGKQYKVAPDDYCLTSTSLGPQLERFTIISYRTRKRAELIDDKLSLATILIILYDSFCSLLFVLAASSPRQQLHAAAAVVSYNIILLSPLYYLKIYPSSNNHDRRTIIIID